MKRKEKTFQIVNWLKISFYFSFSIGWSEKQSCVSLFVRLDLHPKRRIEKIYTHNHFILSHIRQIGFINILHSRKKIFTSPPISRYHKNYPNFHILLFRIFIFLLFLVVFTFASTAFRLHRKLNFLSLNVHHELWLRSLSLSYSQYFMVDSCLMFLAQCHQYSFTYLLLSISFSHDLKAAMLKIIRKIFYVL